MDTKDLNVNAPNISTSDINQKFNTSLNINQDVVGVNL